MGFKRIDMIPPQVTPITPPGKTHLMKVFQVATTDTVASVKAMIPAAASITNIYYHGDLVGSAGSVVTITASNNTGTISTGTFNSETNGAGSGIVQMSNLPNLEATPPVGDISISAVTTATTGGPWRFVVEFVS